MAMNVGKTNFHVQTIPQENHHFLFGGMVPPFPVIGGKHDIVLPTLLDLYPI